MNSTNALIGIIEDEPKLAIVLQEFLESAGYHTRIFASGNGVVEWVADEKPGLLLIDLMLPGKDGLEITREVRQFSDVPIIITTARVEEIDRLLGLELGADDYVCKPYSPREVVARVKAHLRRMDMHSGSGTGTGHQGTLIHLEPERLRACYKDNQQELTTVEFALLQTLLQAPGRIFSRDQLMDRIYRDRRIVSDRTIDSHVKKLRRKLAGLLPEMELIHSVYGAGYRYEETDA